MTLLWKRGSGPVGHSDFRRLWVAQTVSMAGSQISLIVFPLIAVSILEASAWEAGVLSAVERAPFLLFGLAAGALVDRWRLRRVLVVTDWIRAAAVGMIPLAAVLDFFTVELLYVIAFTLGVCTVFFDIAYQSIVPSVVERENLLGANRRLESSRSVVEMVGPGLAAALLKLASAPIVIFFDALSFAVSAMVLRSIPVTEKEPQPASRKDSLWSEVRAGVSFIRRTEFLRWNAAIAATWNLLLQALLALFFIYLVRDLQLSSTKVAAVVFMGSLGSILGVMAVGRVNKVCGLGLGMALATCLSSVGGMLLVAVSGSSLPAVAAVGSSFLLISFGITLFNVNAISVRQTITPENLMGRTTAAMRFVVWGAMPIGSLLGGSLGELFGIRPMVATIGATLLLPTIITLLSPLHRIRNMSDLAPGERDQSEKAAS
ncbi:MFS transporter [Streptomyces sp. NPDC014746]|uniref:MFS transporter n=1 Tax=Streptomyces sp. NPDC014746 TaxID=3364904 RepID=UPI0036F8528C